MFNILIADDHPVVRHGLKDMLTQKLGRLKITEAQDGCEATQWLGREVWDLILLDINLPRRSGLDVLRDARLVCPKTPVVVLSVYPEKEFAIRAFKLGASAYLTKQSACDELVTAVRQVLGGGKYVTPALAELLADNLERKLGQSAHAALSVRELQVLRLIAAGRTLKEIAGELSLSEKTIGTYRLRIAQKLGLASNVELTRYALQHQLAD